MSLPELEKQLREEGFRNTFVWEDEPDRRYSDHTHAVETRTSFSKGR